MRTWSNWRPAPREYKKNILARLNAARADGVSIGRIANACDNEISIHTVYDMLEAKVFPLEMWEQMDDTLKAIGY